LRSAGGSGDWPAGLATVRRTWHRDEARAEGTTRGKAEALLAVLAARGIAVGDAERVRIGERDPVQLDRWLAGAVTCAEAAELFTMRS
jgi:hypothetical protein